jgi:site-specific recombinase XerD
MKTSEFLTLVETAIRRDHKARKTLETYMGWVNRYADWLKHEKSLYQQPPEIKVSLYLSWLATRPGGCSPRTQDQALNALVFAYKKGLDRPLEKMPAWVKPPDRPRMPVWLSRVEFDAITRHLTGDCLELAQLMFGAGLRLNEALKLRVRDLHFEAGLIMVRGGKGDKDRTTCLPRTLAPVLQERLSRQIEIWEHASNSLPPKSSALLIRHPATSTPSPLKATPPAPPASPQKPPAKPAHSVAAS